MFEVAIQILSNIFGKVFRFLFTLEFAPGVSIGTMLIFVSVLSLILFVIFSVISGKDG